MSEALRAIEALNATLGALPNRARLPEIPFSRKVVEAFGAIDSEPTMPAHAVLEQLRARLQLLAQSGFKNAARRDLRDAPWVLWNGRDQAVSLPGLLETICNVATNSTRTLRNLIDAWLRDFEANGATVEIAGQQLQRLLEQNRDHRLDIWRAAQQSVQLFDAKRGPRKFADALAQSERPVAELLAHLGFADAFRSLSGYLKAVEDELLTKASQTLRAGDAEAAGRIFAFVAPGDAFRFKERKSVVAKALLEPWLVNGRQPPDESRDLVREFLLRHLGDPRSRPGDWAGVEPEGQALMRRWLARVSLKAFFDLVDEHARDDHWRYRRAFWTACLEAGAIADAWLALGARVHNSARAIRDLHGAYGRMEGANEQSLLLFRIGSLICCEWSHNGKLRAWPADWQNAPKLGRHSYTRREVMTKGLPFPPHPQTGHGGASDGMGLSHIGSERNYWQISAAELLARRTGIHLKPIDWKPR